MHDSVSRALFAEGVSKLTPELCCKRGWSVHVAEFPVLDLSFTAPSRQTLRLRLDWRDWNTTPPSVAFVSGDGTQPAKPPVTPGNQFNQGNHQATGRPFVCMAGAREYHTHQSHVGDRWDSYRTRSGYDFGGILTQLWHAWRSAQP